MISHSACTKDKSKYKLFFDDDPDMSKKDVANWDLRKLFKNDEIVRLMANRVFWLKFCVISRL